MERDNKKARDEARKEYNDTVRVMLYSSPVISFPYVVYQSLATFIRKRDPRYKAHITRQAQERTIPQDSRSPPSRVTATSSPASQPVFVEQEWQKTAVRDDAIDLEWATAEGEDEEEWECVACGKSFRSEAAWDSHERSRKHLKAVEALKREMEQENEELALEENTVEDTAWKVESTGSGSGSGLDQDEAEQSTFAGNEEQSVIDQEEPKAIQSTPDNEPQVPKMKPGSGREKTRNLPREPLPELIPKSQKRSRKRDIPVDSSADGGLDDDNSLNHPISIFNDVRTHKPQGLSKKEKQHARKGAKKETANRLQVEKLVGFN